MKTKILLTILVSSFFILHSSFGQGALTPPGAPAPTMKSLAQIEPRTPISSAPYIISSPGSYYLTTNLTVSSGDAITIATNGVFLDLSGWTISSSTASASATYGVKINGGLKNLTIENGFIQSGVTNNGAAVYSGSGFGYGISYVVPAPVNVLVSKVSVSGCLYDGINLGTGESEIVESCTVRTVGNGGIRASTVKSSGAKDCGASAITGDQVSDCRGQSSSGGYGVYASATALNCYGSSGTGVGLGAFVALNCQGVSSTSYGIFADYNAQNCYGSSTTGTGLYANNASFCTGYRSGGTAIQATIANGCIAANGSTVITYKYNMP